MVKCGKVQVRKISNSNKKEEKYSQEMKPPAGCFMNSGVDGHVLPEVESRAAVVVALAASEVSLA